MHVLGAWALHRGQVDHRDDGRIGTGVWDGDLDDGHVADLDGNSGGVGADLDDLDAHGVTCETVRYEPAAIV